MLSGGGVPDATVSFDASGSVGCFGLGSFLSSSIQFDNCGYTLADQTMQFEVATAQSFRAKVLMQLQKDGEAGFKHAVYLLSTDLFLTLRGAFLPSP